MAQCQDPLDSRRVLGLTVVWVGVGNPLLHRQLSNLTLYRWVPGDHVVMVVVRSAGVLVGFRTFGVRDLDLYMT